MKILIDLIGVLKALRDLKIRGAIDWVTKGSPRALRISAVLFFLLFAAASIVWWITASDLQQTFFAELKCRTESTAQAHKGVEALIISSVSHDISESLKDVKISPSYEKRLNDFLTSARAKVAAFSPVDPKDKTAVALLTDGLTVVEKGDTLAQKYLTDTVQNSKAFLFLPATVIRPRSNSAGDIKLEAVSSEILLRDILVSRQLSSEICDLAAADLFSTNQGVLRNRPIQSYYIAASGVIRICQGLATDQFTFYKDQFLPTRFFPDRPYFMGTFNNELDPHDKVPVDDFFHRTQPYLDLGGNGIVVTLCKQVLNDETNQTIVCVDLRLKETALSQMQNAVRRLGGWSEWTVCERQGNGIVCDDRLPAAQKEAVQSLGNHYLQKNNEDLSEFFGQIQTLSDTDDHSTRGWFDKLKHGFSSEDNRLMFTVPVMQNGQNKGSLMYGEIDLVAASFSQSLRAGIAVGLLIVFCFALLAIFLDYYFRLQQQNAAFSRVDQVMQYAPVAYVRLGEDDKFVSYNDRFARTLGYKDVAEAKGFIENRRFQDLIVGDMNKRRYNEETERRSNDDATKPYPVPLRAEHDEVTVDIYGAGVPVPHIPGRKLQTFGILLEPRPNVVMMSERDRGATA